MPGTGSAPRSGLRDWEAGMEPRGMRREGRAYTQNRGRETGRPRPLGKQGLRGCGVHQVEGPNPMAVWTKGWLRCCSNGTLGTQSKGQKLSFLWKSRESSALGSHPNPGGFPVAWFGARDKLMGQGRAWEDLPADVAVEGGRAAPAGRAGAGAKGALERPRRGLG